MQKNALYAFAGAVLLLTYFSSCKKDETVSPNSDEISAADKPYNLNVSLSGSGRMGGTIKFRQDPDAAKIITLETTVNNLEPNHEYLLQRAVDAINMVDGNCTSTTWLTLGRGLTPQTILTNPGGTGSEVLWRDLSTIPAGSSFDIHFQVVDAATMAVVLTSNCFKYTVR